jgi:endonuclease/exonuclease/phosphatase family metal-dependent hydrolase
MKKLTGSFVFALLVSLVVLAADRPEGCGAAAATPVTTFNVYWYPKYPGHSRPLFEAIGELEAPIVAVQEVRDARTFRREARGRLGASWRYAEADDCGQLCLGVLFDASRAELVSTRTHRDTVVRPRARPTFEAIFEVDGRAISVFVVHLKAGSRHVSVREAQLEGLRAIVERSRPRRTEFVVLGDFNSVTERDRRLLARFAYETGLHWSSESLECSHYWDRPTPCAAEALDHIFSSREEVEARPEAACATIGCELDGACPAWARRVSDHCPVTIELD